MTHSDLPDDLQQFIEQYITSIEQLEVLLLLHRRARRLWSAMDVARELSSTVFAIECRLFDLLARQLLGSRPRNGELVFWYEPGPHDGMIMRLSREYSVRRSSIINAIFAAPIDRTQPITDVYRIIRGTSTANSYAQK